MRIRTPLRVSDRASKGKKGKEVVFFMDQAQWTIGIVTFFVMLIVILKSKANIVLRFLVQAVVGGALIYGMNQFFLSQNLVSIIALNPLTILTCGFLGIPGVILLFCIQILSML